MPANQQQQQQQHHHHHHHAFSSIGTFLHALQPSSHHSNSSSNSSVVAPVSPAISRHGSSEFFDSYRAFQSQVSQRLSSLLPAEDYPTVSLPCLKDLMELLLATQRNLRTLVPAHHKQIGTMKDFLERNVKLLDVCRGIKEQMLEMETLQGILDLVILCLRSDKGETNQVSRARKALTQLLLHMEGERADQTVPVHTHRSFHVRIRERLGGCGHDASPQRWHSWHAASSLSHGNHGSSASSSWHGNNAPAQGNSTAGIGTHAPAHGNHASTPLLHSNHGFAGPAGHMGGNTGSQTWHTLELNLSSPKLPPKDEEECFSAAIYSLNVLSLFSLATITAALPGVGKAHSPGFIHPLHTVVWASPFLRLQQRVDAELGKRSRRCGTNAGLWELEQILLLGKRLYEVIEHDDGGPRPVVDEEEEVKKLGRQLRQHGEELKRDMGILKKQIDEFYECGVAARMRVLDMLREASE